MNKYRLIKALLLPAFILAVLLTERIRSVSSYLNLEYIRRLLDVRFSSTPRGARVKMTRAEKQ